MAHKKKERPQPVKEAGAVVPAEKLRERENLRIRRANLRREERDGTTLTLVDVTVAEADRVNRNGRLYPKEVWEAAIAAAQADIPEGKLWGLLEHEEGDWYGYGPAKGRLRNIAMLFESLYMDGTTVKATAVLPDTEAGNILRGLVEAGVAVGISSSGRASQKYLPAGEVMDNPTDPEELIAVIQDDFRLDTIDAVGDPSDPSGLVKAIESLQPAQQGREADPPSIPEAESEPQPAPAPAPAPIQTPKEESYMHPKLKALLERLGKTLEQVKSENNAEYLSCLEDIAAERAELAESAGRVPGLENEVARLKKEAADAKADLETERTERRREQRIALVDRVIAEAELPLLDPYKDGDKEVDLNAEFRNDLVEAAVAAESDESATALVAGRVARRKHELGARQIEARTQPPAPAAGAAPSLPIGQDPAGPDEVQELAALANTSFAAFLRG